MIEVGPLPEMALTPPAGGESSPEESGIMHIGNMIEVGPLPEMALTPPAGGEGSPEG